MFCPSCLTPNAPDEGECQHCRADLAGLRQRVSIGAQFVFADASPRRPVALSLDGEEPQIFTKPTLLSRHRHGLAFGESHHRPTRRRQKPARPGVDLPRLPAPAGPDLTAVITERKIYRPRDEAHIFIVAPDARGGQVEMEVEELPEEERGEYLRALGIAEPARQRFIQASYELLTLISFITHNAQEVRAWPIRKGTSAVQAAGKVHTDMERGFIRAEVIHFDDLMACGSEAKCRETGKLRVEGRDYVVQDGDIVHFRFNV